MEYKSIVVNKKDSIGTIKMNKPQVLNALDKDTIAELTNAVEELDKDKNIKVAILTGEGKAFIAGADIKQMKDMNSAEAKKFAESGHKLMTKISNSRLPFIAAVNGYALGGGCEIMMACDLCIAATSAKFGQPEINLGVPPGFGGTQRLPRLVGRMKANELLLTGDIIDANEAHRIGLVNMVVPDDKIIEEAERFASKLASKSAIQLDFIKSLVNKGIEVELSKACTLEISQFSKSFETEDQKEGMTAFLEKRKPNFKGK
jgi:enoyl-CoA hydratase